MYAYQMELEKLKTLLTKPQEIVILTHAYPDGDAIGSALAVYLYLLKKGHNCSVIVPNEFPTFLQWMKAWEKIIVYTDEIREADRLIDSASLIFCLDFNNPERLEDACRSFIKANAVTVLIDHHLKTEKFCSIDLATMHTSSTSELVYDVICELGDEQLIDKGIAECLFTGIMTDTGSFSYSCNSEKTWHVASKLIARGIDSELIHRLVYYTYSEKRMRLLGFCLSEKMVVMPEFHVAYITLSKEEMDRFDYKIGDTEGVVNLALSIEGVNLAALIAEKEKYTKLSLRSIGDINVGEMARKHFDGGGHRNASGANLNMPLERAIEEFIGLIQMYKEKLTTKEIK